MDDATRDAILWLSGFAGALALWLGVMDLRGRHWLMACLGPGIAIVVLLVMEAVFGAPTIPFNWRTALYVVGLALLFLGIAGYLRGRKR